MRAPIKLTFHWRRQLYISFRSSEDEQILLHMFLSKMDVGFHGYQPMPVSEWVIEFNSLFGTVDTGVHVVHTSCVIITYTSELLSSLT